MTWATLGPNFRSGRDLGVLMASTQDLPFFGDAPPGGPRPPLASGPPGHPRQGASVANHTSRYVGRHRGRPVEASVRSGEGVVGEIGWGVGGGGGGGGGSGEGPATREVFLSVHVAPPES